ncbi:hypothetical protein DFH08DRAFT_958474 [Mycena albidolilacea]|uniref:Uncharacterized protein n=1 Tax=Mycena albidolilacea TaxID=1033008 RepID=A0AAD7A724_9AGAR|nr:hypothetical protein DFH08DRAFT_958474 [Mycena albidolilacea]
MLSVKESVQDKLKTAHTASNKGKKNNPQLKKPSKEKQPKEMTKKARKAPSINSKSAPRSVPTGGKKPADLQAEIAQALFITPEAPAEPMFEAEDLGTLIARLKKGYCDQCEKLGVTGVGGLDADREGEIEASTDLKNIWDTIQTKFPWYKQMHVLMGTSPVIARGTLSHSQLSVDLSVLDSKSERTRKIAVLDNEEEDESSSSSESAILGWVKTDEEDGDAISILSSSPAPVPLPQTPKTPAARVKAEPVPASAMCGTKHKLIQETVQDPVEQDQAQCLKMAQLREKEKLVWA